MQPVFRLASAQLIAALGVVALIGCNTGSRSTKTTTTPPAAIAVAVGGGVANQNSAIVGQAINGLVFQLTNPSTTQPLTLNSVTITASGTADDAAMITTVTLREDLDSSGTVTGGDRTIAATDSTAFATNNGTTVLTVTATPAATIPVSSTRQYLVTYETIANIGSATHAGQTITLTIAGASSIAVVGTTGQTITFTGLPLSGDTVTLGISNHLLISEVVTAAAGEYVEIFNPSGTAIDLTNVHLSDFTSGTGGMRYDVLPTGTNYHVPLGRADTSTSDFAARFPAVTLAPGAYATIAVDGAQHTTAYGTAPTYALKNATAPTMLMGTWDGVASSFNFSNAAPGIASTATDFFPATGEPIYLYTWNGSVMASAPDLVTDFDIVVYGNSTGFVAGDAPTFKGSAAQDGPDTGATTTAYPTETLAATQTTNRIVPTVTQVSIRRTNYLEGTQTATGGNGVAGRDETSEVWSSTFQAFTTATPGAP